MAPPTHPLGERNRRKRLAVQLRLEGKTLEQTSMATGLSAPTIISAYKAFQEGGWPAVVARNSPGRPTQSDKQLDHPLLPKLIEAMFGRAKGWTLSDIQQWLKSQHDHMASKPAIRQFLEKHGWVTASKPLANTPATHDIKPFSAEPDLATLAHLTDKRGHHFWFPVAQGAAQVSDYLALLNTLIARFANPVHLTMSGAAAFQGIPEINNFLAKNAQKITLTAPASDNFSTPAIRRQMTPNPPKSTMSLTHLQRLEAESIHILREVVAEADRPVMLYSIGKDSAVMLHLAMKAFYPAKPPFPLLHVDTRWKFQDMYTFRDRMARELGLDLIVHVNPEGEEKNINPFTHGSAIHTDIMKTEGLKQALDKYGFDAAFGGARRDEEKSRAKERIFSFRSAQHRWDPKNQRPELWKLYNARKHKGESIRVFPLSNWTELDIWQYVYLENIPIVPLYYAAERPVVERDGTLIMVDDARMPLRPGEIPMMKKVRFRTLGCYPLTGAIESEANTLPQIIQEMLLTTTSERQGRVIDHDSTGSMEKKKQEGYF